MKNILQVQNLTISLRKNQSPIVNNISFDVKKGTILGIIGESGSGKTLSCRAIMHLLDNRIFFVKGKAIFENKDLLSMSNQEIQPYLGSSISMIMQNPMTAFDPVCKIGNQIIETLCCHKRVSKHEAYEIGISNLKKIGLDDSQRIMNSYPHMLSGGMLQRIMIAICLMLKPQLIIADEATTALDVHTQAVILKEFKRIRDTGITLIIVTHDFGVLAKLADNVIVVKDGTIIENGTVYEIFDSPKHTYTKELLKASILRREI